MHGQALGDKMTEVKSMGTSKTMFIAELIAAIHMQLHF
jgi:hypothetical protein